MELDQRWQMLVGELRDLALTPVVQPRPPLKQRRRLEKGDSMSLMECERRRRTTLFAIAGLGGSLALWLAACAPNSAATGAQTKPPALPATQQSGSTSAAVTNAATAVPPSSAALPAPTQGGVPPTVVGRSQPTTSEPRSQAATGTATPQPAAHVTVSANRTFDPANVTINAGETVQWVNAGRAPQTVTGDPAKVQNKADAVLPSGAQPWDSGTLNTGQTFTHRFDTPGEYTYTSLPAEGQGLVGRISVR
jgi:plastocyanin